MLGFFIGNMYCYPQLYDLYVVPQLANNILLEKNIAIISNNGQYVSVDEENKLVANKDTIGEKEKFKLIKVAHNKIALLSYNKKFVCAEKGGGYELIANREVIGNWETFTIFPIGNGKVTMRVYNGKYIVINNDEERMLISDKDGIVLSGRFRIIELV
jgi:hypothetical protein